MTNSEAIQQLEFERAMILFDPAKGKVMDLESIKALNKENYLTYLADGVAIEALKEIQLYKDNKLCLVPEDVYSRQCSELDAYKEIGTVEECRKAVEKQKPKKPALRNNNGKLRKNCPNCGAQFFEFENSEKLKYGRAWELIRLSEDGINEDK